MGWLIVGFVGQFTFGIRFLVQWIASERAGRSLIPNSFWYLSIAGSVILLSYAVHREDPVFIIGQLFGSIVYVRNLVLLQRERMRNEALGATA